MSRLEDIKAAGAQKDVEVLKDNPDVVRATFKNPEHHQAYSTYLTGKLAHIFFPDIVPKVLAFGQRQDSGRYYMDVERVPLDAMHLKLQAGRNMSKEARADIDAEQNAHELEYYTHKYGKLFSKFREISASFRDAGLTFDPYPLNWTLADNRTRNVDFKSGWMNAPVEGGRQFNPENIRSKISTLPTEKQKREASAILDELIGLEVESNI